MIIKLFVCLLFTNLVLCSEIFNSDSSSSNDEEIPRNDEKHDAIPEQIHIAIGTNLSQIVVVFATGNDPKSPCAVHYGVNELNFTSEAEKSYFFYGNWKGVQFHHRAVLQDLLPEQVYQYQVVCDQNSGEIFRFKTCSLETNWSPEFIVYGDMGLSGGEPTLHLLSMESQSLNYAAVLHVGDFAYDFHNDDGRVGDDFMRRIQSIAAYVPYMTAPGNHESFFDFVHYRTRFSMPSLPWPMEKSKLWFSFDVGPTHFISYSTEVYFFDDMQFVKAQYDWLLGDLKQANAMRSVRPWVIAFGHRPMYCSNMNRDDCTKPTSLVRMGLEQLFFEQGVDLIIQAHEHSYERLWPVFNETMTQTHYVDPRAPVHVISGSAGCNEFHGVCVNPILGPRGPWSAFRAWLPGLYGFGKLKAFNSTHLYWSQVLAVNNQTMDEFWLIQHNHGPFP